MHATRPFMYLGRGDFDGDIRCGCSGNSGCDWNSGIPLTYGVVYEANGPGWV